MRGPGEPENREHLDGEHETKHRLIARRGIRAEAVAEQAVAEAERYLAAPDVPVGDCLADQLLLPFALAGGGSYRTLALTRHSETNIGTIRAFLPTQVVTREEPGGAVRVEVRDAAG